MSWDEWNFLVDDLMKVFLLGDFGNEGIGESARDEQWDLLSPRVGDWLA